MDACVRKTVLKGVKYFMQLDHSTEKHIIKSFGVNRCYKSNKTRWEFVAFPNLLPIVIIIEISIIIIDDIMQYKY